MGFKLTCKDSHRLISECLDRELSLMERTLVARINAESGRAPVRRIRWELLR